MKFQFATFDKNEIENNEPLTLRWQYGGATKICLLLFASQLRPGQAVIKYQPRSRP
jgi:hypothetical protein